MPFYEYQCDDCGHRFEVMQSIKAEPVKTCEECGSPVRRILFPSAIIYKGSGFYATEYGRSTHNNPTKKSSSVDIPTSTKKEEKKEAKGKSEKSSAKPASDSSSAKAKESKSSS